MPTAHGKADLGVYRAAGAEVVLPTRCAFFVPRQWAGSEASVVGAGGAKVAARVERPGVRSFAVEPGVVYVVKA